MKNKLLSIFALFLFILFISSVDCFGVYDINDNGDIRSLPDLPFDTSDYPDYVLGVSYSSNVKYYAVAYPLSDFEYVFKRDYTNNGYGYYVEGNTYGEWRYFFCNYDTLNSWNSGAYTQSGNLKFSASGYLIESTFDIYTSATYEEIYFEKNINSDIQPIYPGISNTVEDLEASIYDYILVTPGTFSSSENIDLHIYNITNLEDGSDAYSQTPVFYTTLNSSSSYYKSVTVDDVTEFWYEIPRDSLGINFKYGDAYLYSLLLDGSPIQEINVIVNNSNIGSSEEDIIIDGFNSLEETITESNKELQQSIDTQTEAIKESNETNKNIFEKIGEILSYLNPFSENFFAYKLVELIVDGLKSLFIPADDFFSLYFDELNNWFSDRLGFLYYPLELLFDLLDRFLNINFAEPVINIPDIKEPFTNVTLINSVSFNFNDLLENKTLKNVHDIYFIIVDAFIYIGLVGLLYRKYEEVMTK